MLHGLRSPKKKRKMNIIMILGKVQKRRPRGFLGTIWVGPFPKSLHIFRKLGPNSSLYKTGWIARKSLTTRGGHESPKYFTSWVEMGLKARKFIASRIGPKRPCFSTTKIRLRSLQHFSSKPKSLCL